MFERGHDKDIIFVAAGLSGFTLILCAADGVRYLIMGLLGYEELPYHLSRRYWRRVLVRMICRLAELEAAEKKNPAQSGNFTRDRRPAGEPVGIYIHGYCITTDARCQGEFAARRRVALVQ